jgi:uncharacterized lipoprotein
MQWRINMKTVVKLFAAAACITLGACEVKQTENAQLPDVDVNVSGGQLPEYNVQGPDVEVGTKNETIQVPTVDVKTPAEQRNEQ